MYNKIIEDLKNKHIAILGFGKEGKSTYNFLRKYLQSESITIIDQNTNLLECNSYLQDDNNLNLVLGDNYLDNLNNYDVILKSPGIKIPDENISDIKNILTSQIDFALKLYRNQIIGITGTKGKSTTSSLLYKVLSDQGKDCYLLGNVGKPIFDYIENITKDTILILEMSSYQLDLVKISPHIGVILNLFEDHLNYHGTKSKYHAAKLNMFKYQTENDIALYTSNDLTLKNYIDRNNYSAKFIDITKEFIETDTNVIYNNLNIYDKTKERHLIGNHNLVNILFVLRLSILLNLDLTLVEKSINEFKPLEHRMEYVGTYSGIKYYNDSIATIPEATINCIESIKDVDTIIFGGLDRGISYDKLIEYFNKSNITNFIAMPETGYKIADKLIDKKVYKVVTLEEAVNIAKKVTKNTCLLSPAASSYNSFKNFEEKGKIFKELVKD